MCFIFDSRIYLLVLVLLVCLLMCLMICCLHALYVCGVVFERMLFVVVDCCIVCVSCVWFHFCFTYLLAGVGVWFVWLCVYFFCCFKVLCVWCVVCDRVLLVVVVVVSDWFRVYVFISALHIYALVLFGFVCLFMCLMVDVLRCCRIVGSCVIVCCLLLLLCCIVVVSCVCLISDLRIYVLVLVLLFCLFGLFV